MVAPYAIDGSHFTVAPPYQWPNGRYQTRGRNRMFDLHPDDDHVVLAHDARALAGDEPATASFVFNLSTNYSTSPRRPARAEVLARLTALSAAP